MRARAPLALAGGLTLAAGLVFTRALGTRTNYDEGVYLASLAALRRGQELGTDVYTSQPPVFYWVLRLAAAPFGTSVEGIRFGFALVGLAGVVAAIVVGWRLFGAAAGIAAGALLAIGPPYPTVAPTVSADVPAVALGLASLATLVFALGRPPRRGPAVAAGALLAAGVLTKLLAAPFAAPFVALVLAHRAGRRLLPAAAAGAGLLVAAVALVHLGSLGAIWEAVVSDHTGASELGSHAENARWLRDHLEPRTPIAWLTLTGLVALALSRPARRTWPLWTLLPAAWAFLVLVRPLADHHFVLLSAAYALGAGPSLALAIGGLRRPALRVLASSAVALLVAAGLFQEQRRLQRNDAPEPADVMWAVAGTRALTGPDAVVVTDQPIIVFRADRATPGALVDASNTRITGGGLTTAEILAEIDGSRPELVVVGRMFRSLPEVLAGLEARYPVGVRCGDVTLHLPATADTTRVPPCPEAAP